MRVFACIVLTLFVTGAVAVEPAGPDVAKMFATWKEGYETRDLAKVLSIYTKDLTYSYQGQPDLNYEQLRSTYITDFQAKHPKWRWESVTDSVSVDAKLAVAVSRWKCFDDTAADGPKLLVKIRSVDLMKMTPEGWKIFHTINYPEP